MTTAHQHLTAYDRLVAALRDHGCAVQEGVDGRAKAQCVSHEDRNPSLAISPRRDGKGVVLHCHAGCGGKQIVADLGLTQADLFDEPKLKAVYRSTDTYRYDGGRRVHRKPDKSFPQSGNKADRTLYHQSRLTEAAHVYVVEGEKDVRAVEAVGGVATCSAMGAGKAKHADWEPLAGKAVTIIADKDEAGRDHARDLAEILGPIATCVRVVEAAEGCKDAADHIAAGHGLGELVAVSLDPPPVLRTPEEQTEVLGKARDVFRLHLGDEYDLDALDVVLVAAAVERLDGEPLWVLIVGGSGNAKTETVQALQGLPDVHVVSTIASQGALLSATSRRDTSPDATGGLLRQIGEHGILVVKDVTSVLSMGRELRAEVLAALREIYDGRWIRTVGTDGGKRLAWEGRLVVVGAVTTAWDTHHGVIAAMGDRFPLLRLDSSRPEGRLVAGRRAVKNTGNEDAVRADLAGAVSDVMAGVARGADVPGPDDGEVEQLLAAADLVTLARTGVEYDHQGNVTDAHAPEMPTRLVKQLAQVLRGGLAIGMTRAEAMRLALRCARDSVPPMRLAIIDHLAAHSNQTTTEVRVAIGKPRSSVDRQLQALHMLGVLECTEGAVRGLGKQWLYRIAGGIDPKTLVVPGKPTPEMSVIAYAQVREAVSGGPLRTPCDVFGDAPTTSTATSQHPTTNPQPGG